MAYPQLRSQERPPPDAIVSAAAWLICAAAAIGAVTGVLRRAFRIGRRALTS
jgi:hypothetical protein